MIILKLLKTSNGPKSLAKVFISDNNNCFIGCIHINVYRFRNSGNASSLSGGSLLFRFRVCLCTMLFIFVLGTVNGVNFTDGIDGLATSVTLVVAIFLPPRGFH